MTRGRKLLTVGLILATGIGLAWPFRKSDREFEPVAPLTSPPADTLRASNGDPIASQPRPTPKSEIPIAPSQVAAQTASTRPTAELLKSPGNLESFDIANHPALVGTVSPPKDDPSPAPPTAESPSAQPAYEVGSATASASVDKWPAELVHIVANGDTLEKLAHRYLHDAGRALEIFDLNRDQLSNPHLLPIGVELRVPRTPDRIID